MSFNQWQSTLIADGASINNEYVSHFGDFQQELKITESANTLCDLSHLGQLEINGEDAVIFLQGQLTNDIKQLNGSKAHLSGYCNPKGRLLALFLALSHQNHLYLQFPKPLVEPISKRLKMFVMRSKVNISNVSDIIIKFGINGPNARDILSKHFTHLPETDYAIESDNGVTIIQLPSIESHARFEVMTTIASAITLWHALKPNCTLVGKACWDWIDIQSGIPEVYPETQEQFVPQMLNLDLLNGINFKKGCYTGQEIVARTHYLGKVKRRTYLTQVSSNKVSILPGDKLFDSTKSEAGQVVRVAQNGLGGQSLLVELRTEAQKAGDITWQDQKLIFKTLPYFSGVDDA